ncbi:hypothetical protein D3C85_1890560 [compost metagenome]
MVKISYGECSDAGESSKRKHAMRSKVCECPCTYCSAHGHSRHRTSHHQAVQATAGVWIETIDDALMRNEPSLYA